MPEADALLATGQPKSALSSMLRQLHIASQTFASSTGMVLPPGDAVAVTNSVPHYATPTKPSSINFV